MRSGLQRGMALLVVLTGLSLAGGLDFGVSVRNGPNGSFMGHLGVYLEGFPVDFRSQLVFGAPQGLFLSGEVLYPLPIYLLLRPYLGGGLAVGLSAYTADSELRLRFGGSVYGILTAGVQFPSRGYTPYIELSQYVGSDTFTRFTVGFISAVF
ncbi:hypothetical protein [Meiothermus granaticius]|nr:hypothetical protein [Meiothermus granaticius]GEM87121.1 hypothetical protein MGR01S_17460 [Meiothermus granaticius NBRC 107808]